MQLALYFHWIIQGLTLQLCFECLLFAVAGVGEPDSRPLGGHILVGKSRIMWEAHTTSRLLSLVLFWAISPASHHVHPDPSPRPSPQHMLKHFLFGCAQPFVAQERVAWTPRQDEPTCRHGQVSGAQFKDLFRADLGTEYDVQARQTGRQTLQSCGVQIMWMYRSTLGQVTWRQVTWGHRVRPAFPQAMAVAKPSSGPSPGQPQSGIFEEVFGL